MTRHSNYFKHHVVVNGGVMQEQICRACKGTGEDPHTPDADCIQCWGEGTLELTEAA